MPRPAYAEHLSPPATGDPVSGGPHERRPSFPRGLLAAPILKAPRVPPLGLFLPQGAGAGAFLGDLHVAADRVGADHVGMRLAGLTLFERGHLGRRVVLE